MAMNSELALIRYNLRCKLYHAAAEKAVQFLGEERETKNRGTFLFWRACSLGKKKRNWGTLYCLRLH